MMLFRPEAHAFHARGFVELEFPYLPELIEELKRALDARDRIWDARKKCWLISEECWSVAQPIVERYCDLMD
jgi:hypothetical protein